MSKLLYITAGRDRGTRIFNLSHGSLSVNSMLINTGTGTVVEFGCQEPPQGAEIMTLPEGSYVIPGIADNHTHWLFELVGGSQSLARTTIHHESPVNDFRVRLKFALAANPSGTVVFTDWNDTTIPAAMVREIVMTQSPGREVLVLNSSWHNAVASDALLNRVMPGIDAIKDACRLQGSCRNNVIDEDYLIQLLARLKFDGNAIRKALLKRQQLMLSRGITRIFDKMILGMPLLEALADLSITGDLIIPTDGAIQPWMMEAGVVPRQHGDNFRVRWLKYFADGAFGNRKARMCFGPHSWPYNGTSNVGIDMLPSLTQIQRDIHRWREMGGDGACVHCIGPGATLGTTNLFKEVLQGGLGPGFTLGFEHMEACPPRVVTEVARLQQSGARIEVCSQPGFLDDVTAYTDRLGEDVLGIINPYNSFGKEGLSWTFGTDGPITGDRVFEAFSQAVNREGPERIKASDMIRAALDTPLIDRGPATFIVVDRYPFLGKTMGEMKVLQTWIKGRKVYDRATEGMQ